MMETRGMRIVLLVNMGIGFLSLLVLAMEATGLINLVRLDGASRDHAAGMQLLWWVLTIAFLIFNGVFVLERFVVRRATHLKAKGDQGEYLVSIAAVEESLSRIARAVPDVHNARVAVYKEKREGKPVHIEVHFMAYEDMDIPEVTRRLQEVVGHRFQQIAGTDMRPQFNTVLSRIVERTEPRPTERRRKEDVVDLSKGPIYPVRE